MQRPLELLERVQLQAQVLQRSWALPGIQDSEYDSLSENRREGRDPDVNNPTLFSAGNPDTKAAVLRLSAFADVEIGKDLDPGYDGVANLADQGGLGVKDPVDSEPDHQALLPWLEVDVTGRSFHSPAQERVNELNTRNPAVFFLLFR